MNDNENDDVVAQLLREAAEDYAKYHSQQQQEQLDYEKGFVGNNSGFTEEGSSES